MQQHWGQWPRKRITAMVQHSGSFAFTTCCRWSRLSLMWGDLRLRQKREHNGEQYRSHSDTVGGPTPCAEEGSIER
eukprot:3038046-Pyramimonas_sp.AAC.1